MITPDPSQFRAPLTNEVLTAVKGGWTSLSGTSFPFIGDIPLLFPDARLVLAEMKSRATALIGYYEQNVEHLKAELKAGVASSLTRERLEKTRSVQIHHLEFLRDLFSPLKLNLRSPGATPDFGYRLPPSQALQGYFPNLVRDWSVHSHASASENNAQFELVREAAGSRPLGRLLVAGSGGGRLAYDVHEKLAPTETICADLNVVLTLASARLTKGERLKIAEFPTAPKNMAAASGVIRDCQAPKPAREGLTHIFADVYYLPFADASLDTVLTPWLVDILPHRLEFIVSEINRVLKPGGIWINSGSFHFRFANWRDTLSIEEGLEAIQSNGFTLTSHRQDPLPYLNSDLEAHARTELVTTFTMEKTGSARQPVRAPVRPKWLLDSAAAVPVLPTAPAQFASLESQAFVLSQVDGKRTALQIAELVRDRYGLSEQDALEAVILFLERLEGESIFRSSLLA